MTTKNKIYLSPPHLGALETELVLKALDSNWVAPAGPELDEFERLIRQEVNQSCSKSEQVFHQIRSNESSTASHQKFML